MGGQKEENNLIQSFNRKIYVYLKPAEPKTCASASASVCVYLLQGAEGGISTGEIEPAVGGAEGGQVSQSQVLRQQQTLGQTGLLALTQQLRHLRVQTQFCRARRGES